MSETKPLTMSAEDEREDRFAAADKSGSGTCDPYRLLCAWAEIDALRQKLAEVEREGGTWERHPTMLEAIDRIRGVEAVK